MFDREFEQSMRETILNAPPEAHKALSDMLLKLAQKMCEAMPEEVAIEPQLVSAYKEISGTIHEAFREYALPIDPRIEGSKELQKELLPARKAFLEWMQLTKGALEGFLKEVPLPEIPEAFKESVRRNR